MISFACGRSGGLAIWPALFLSLLLVGCGERQEGHTLEGVALGTGYHITLNDDLDETRLVPLEVAIQGELASLDAAFDAWQVRLSPRLPVVGVPPSQRVLLQAWQLEWQALAVDRLDAHLAAYGIQDTRIELGGMVRARGHDRRRPWRLALDHTWLPDPEAPWLALVDAALVSLEIAEAGPAAASPGEAVKRLAVSALAPSAGEALARARRLLANGTESGDERMARLVVLTPEGIVIEDGEALESLLRR